ncbi:MAG: glutamine--fructose-6-phosphate transaminase (isomerizing), partial [Bacilli bacterium]|nr:glutamine--fructose-6-phosphate transaminase (isomerizing) [Bacilli bacterium]
PHVSNSGRFIIVHNGVIENYKSLKLEKLHKYTFNSETDTEIIANLIEFYSRKGYETDRAIRTAVSLLEGSYALLIIDKQNLNKIYFAKNKTPMLVGKGSTGVTIASDTLALVDYADNYAYLDDKTLGYAEEDKIVAFDIAGNPCDLEFNKLAITAENISKNNFEHYMLKEIYEQPGIIRKLIDTYFEGDNTILINEDIIRSIRQSDHIYIAACGTSLHSGYIAKYYFEKLCGIPVDCLIASEAAYEMPLLSENPFFIFVSQSGETADLISVIKKCHEYKIPNLAITNSPYSSIDTLADNVLHLYAGKEISVASTKAYTSQVVTFSILARAIANKKTSLRNNLNKLALAIESVLENRDIIESVAEKFVKATDAFYIGRGLSYYACLEATLKLKEISYVHAEAYASGELK